MKTLRRYFVPGRTYFLTHVTHDRRPILVANVQLLWDAIHKYREMSQFDLIAWAILPDHWHVIIDPQENDLSALMRNIKLSFAQRYLKSTGQQRGRTWQNRYWDHLIRDVEDMNRHLDYIHFNAVKHGIVDSPHEYAHSSFRLFVDRGLYAADWRSDIESEVKGEFGE